MIEVFDSSMIKEYRACPKKFFYRYIRHLKSVKERAFETAFGHAGHEALAVHYKGGTAQESNKVFTECWLPHEGTDPKEKRTLARGLIILDQYRKKFDGCEPFEVFDPKYIEIGFSLDLGEYIVCGKMDGIVQWNLLFTGLVVLEHKFSNSKGFLITEPNQQLDTYIWAATMLIDKPIIGAYFNQIYHVAKDPLKNEFVRELSRRSPAAIKNWEVETLDWMNRINDDKTYPQNSNNCGAYFRSCPYKPLCLEFDKDEHEKLVELCYNVEKWEPFPDARKDA